MLLSGLKVAFPLFSSQDFAELSSAVVKEPSANNNHNKFFDTSKPHSLTIDVKDMVVLLLPVFTVYHFFDAILTTIAGILRAYNKTLVPTFIFGVFLWCVGFLGGY